MTRHVQNLSARQRLAQPRLRGVGIAQDAHVGKQAREVRGFRLGARQRRQLRRNQTGRLWIGDDDGAQIARGAPIGGGRGALLLREEREGGRNDNGVILDQIATAASVEQRRERHAVQRVVGNDDERGAIADARVDREKDLIEQRC